MRRTISEILDPGPSASEQNQLWTHFQSSCAFCGVHIERSSRTGHLDHLDGGGGNGPKNRVLACARCNGDEKRDRDWQEFLHEKNPDESAEEERRERIESWIATHPSRPNERSPSVQEALDEAERLVEEFHAACTRLRDAVRSNSV